MLSLKPITIEGVLLLIGVAVVLATVSWLFNNYIDALVESDPLGSNSSTFSVLGVAYTLVGALAMLTILVGWQLAIFAVGAVLVCFGVSGTPMIFGDMRRGSRRRRNQHHKSTTSHSANHATEE